MQALTTLVVEEVSIDAESCLHRSVCHDFRLYLLDLFRNAVGIGTIVLVFVEGEGIVSLQGATAHVDFLVICAAS